MIDTIVTNILGLPVEQSIMFGERKVSTQIPRPGRKPLLPMSRFKIGTAHTTEGGSNWKSAWATLNKNYSAPHFIVCAGFLVQCRPLNKQGAALVSGANDFLANSVAGLQLEIAANSRQTPYLFDDKTNDTLATLIAWASLPVSGFAIPVQRVVGPEVWPDDVSDMKGKIWATASNSRRAYALKNGIFTRNDGWAMHLEVPYNNHWDCGALRWADIMAAAKGKLANGPQEPS